MSSSRAIMTLALSAIPAPVVPPETRTFDLSSSPGERPVFFRRRRTRGLLLMPPSYATKSVFMRLRRDPPRKHGGFRRAIREARAGDPVRFADFFQRKPAPASLLGRGRGSKRCRERILRNKRPERRRGVSGAAEIGVDRRRTPVSRRNGKPAGRFRGSPGFRAISSRKRGAEILFFWGGASGRESSNREGGVSGRPGSAANGAGR
jgi:hypothetical protein